MNATNKTKIKCHKNKKTKTNKHRTNIWISTVVEKERSEKDVLRQDCNMKWTESFRIWSVWIDVAHIKQECQCLIIRCFCCCHQTAFSFTTKGHKGRKRTTNKQNKQLVLNFKNSKKKKKKKRKQNKTPKN